MTYEELKAELTAVAALVRDFPGPIQLRAFELLTEKLLGESHPAPPTSPSVGPKPLEKPPRTPPAEKRRVTHRSSGKESYSIDRNLNLRGDKSIPAFKAFVAEKQPRSAKEFNVVAVYYLTKLLGFDAASLDQAYTCYSEVKRKPPEHFKQSFTDTKNKEGWVEFNEAGNVKVPHRGVVFVEHDLPSPAKNAKKDK